MVKTTNNTKKSVSTKSAAKATTKKTAAKAAKPTPKVSVNDTKVICPVCGSEFDVLAEHQHTVKNATVLGMDSGMGTIALPVSKRGDILQQAGIDTSKYFSIELPGGGSQMMKMEDGGRAVPVSADDPVIAQIISQGTVPNRNLFRRWIMSQVFHGLSMHGGFSYWLRIRGYKYQWEQVIKELHDQIRIAEHRDYENFKARNRWFNRELCVAMAEDYCEQLRKDANSRPQHKCKGVPYVTVDHKHVFVSDIEKKLVSPMVLLAYEIRRTETLPDLYEAVKKFWAAASKTGDYKQCAAWKDAYRGMGAYAVMQNLLRFHGCTFPKGNDFYKYGHSGLDMLEDAARAYQNGEGWRLFGLMKQMMEENRIDIDAKMREWSEAKKAKRLRR